MQLAKVVNCVDVRHDKSCKQSKERHQQVCWMLILVAYINTHKVIELLNSQFFLLNFLTFTDSSWLSLTLADLAKLWCFSSWCSRSYKPSRYFPMGEGALITRPTTMTERKVVETTSPLAAPHATPRHATPRHATPRHAIPRHTTPYHATPRHATPRHATPRQFLCHECTKCKS